jgi:hypothetical protein
VAQDGCEYRQGDQYCPERWPDMSANEMCDPCAARAALAALTAALP